MAVIGVGIGNGEGPHDRAIGTVFVDGGHRKPNRLWAGVQHPQSEDRTRGRQCQGRVASTDSESMPRFRNSAGPRQRRQGARESQETMGFPALGHQLIKGDTPNRDKLLGSRAAAPVTRTA